eukprot:scpid79899/ scgid30060/ Activin receptor type-1C; Activin receptor type IC; Activin receptor-like kinase 7
MMWCTIHCPAIHCPYICPCIAHALLMPMHCTLLFLAQVGEARYKAPEVLDGSISRSSFEEFRAADVYSLALIIWELAHACCPANGSSPAYSKPYADSIPEVPSSKDVYEAVCIRKCRPPLPKHWLENEVLSVIHRIINTSWKEHGQKRFSANRIWRNVQALETVKVKRPDNTVM